MNTILFFIIFSLLTLLYTLLGLWSSTKIKTTADYFLAGRNLGLLPVTFTLIATQLGGGMLLGTAQNAYLYGLYGLLYTVGMASGFLILGFGLAARLQSLGVVTTAEVFETYYHSITLKKIASLLSIITMCGIVIGQVVGSRAIIETLNLGAVGNECVFIGFWLFVILYTMLGGLHAVVITDIFQVLVIITVFATIFFYALFYGPSFEWMSLAQLQHQFGTMPLSMNSIIATLIMPALFSFIEQDLAQRFFAARTQSIAAFSALLSAAFMIFFALVPIYFGMQAKLLGIQAGGKSPLIPVIEFLTNDLVAILALCAIIAAITSTADSLLCAISSNVAQDFDFSWMGVHNAVRRSQMITLIIGLGALISSYFVPQNIITILIESYTISVSCLLVPLLFAYLSPSALRARRSLGEDGRHSKGSKKAAYCSILLGTIGLCIIPFWQTEMPKALLPLALSFIGYIFCVH